MRLVTYSFDDRDRVGVLDDDYVVEVPVDSMLDLLRRGEEGLEAARAALAGSALRRPLSQVRLRAPLPRPNTIRDFMLVEEHVKGSGLKVADEWYEIPVYYKGNPEAVFGPDDDIRWPAYTEKLDYELELAAVIGRECFRVTEEEASDYIAGYTIFNDWSARDIQMREMRVLLGPGLGKDFANSLGPALATPDGFDPKAARMEARVNGETWSSGTLGAMQFSFPYVIAHLSQEQTLRPGDILGSGTIGRGCGLELDRWIEPGDVVELEVEGIGVLRNRVVEEGSC